MDIVDEKFRSLHFNEEDTKEFKLMEKTNIN